MDPHSAPFEDELNALASRLAGWRPAEPELPADRMLFAAGLAAGRASQRRWPWQAACAALALVAAGTGLWGLSEHRDRVALARTFHEPAVGPEGPVPALVADEPAPSLSPDGYYRLRRLAEVDPEGWLASTPAPSGSAAAEGAAPESRILHPGQYDRLVQ